MVRIPTFSADTFSESAALCPMLMPRLALRSFFSESCACVLTAAIMAAAAIIRIFFML